MVHKIRDKSALVGGTDMQTFFVVYYYSLLCSVYILLSGVAACSVYSMDAVYIYSQQDGLLECASPIYSPHSIIRFLEFLVSTTSCTVLWFSQLSS